MARIIWVHCPDTMVAELPETGWESKEAEEEDKKKAVREKRRAVELCLAFAVAVKHCELCAKSAIPWKLTQVDQRFARRGRDVSICETLDCPRQDAADGPRIQILRGPLSACQVPVITSSQSCATTELTLSPIRPSYNLPSGIPPPDQAYADQNQSVEQLKSRSASPFRGRERVADTPMSRSPTSTLNKLGYENKSMSSAAGFAGMHGVLTASVISSSPQSLRYNQPFSQPKLRPSRCPPKHHWSEAMPIRYLPFAKKERRQRRLKQAIYADSYLMGHGETDSVNGMPTAQNVPLEITMYMVS
jgi:hypothetical protein